MSCGIEASCSLYKTTNGRLVRGVVGQTCAEVSPPPPPAPAKSTPKIVPKPNASARCSTTRVTWQQHVNGKLVRMAMDLPNGVGLNAGVAVPLACTNFNAFEVPAIGTSVSPQKSTANYCVHLSGACVGRSITKAAMNLRI